MKLLVVSIDAMFTSDLSRLQSRPGLASLWKHCLTVRDLRTVYPALTYPCHVSILSGNPPAVHGIYQNLECVPNAVYKNWKWYYQDVKCETLFDYIHQAGMRSASVFWPVSANAPVDYLVPEIWSYTGDPVDIILNTSGGAVDHIIQRHREDVDFTSKFKLDRFAKNCAVDIVDEFDPDVLFLHFSLVDNTRHRYGIHHPRVEDALDQCAVWLEEVLSHINRKTPTDQLAVAVLGDHGHLNCRGCLSMNRLFAQRGWISDPLPDKLETCRVFCHAAGISAQVYVNDQTLRNEVEDLFAKLKTEGWLLDWYPKTTVEQWGLSGPFDYVLEGGDGYYFVDAIKERFFTETRAVDGGPFIGKHGHCPLRGEKPPFVLSWSQLENQELQDKSVLDIAPTLCELFHLPHETMQGESLLHLNK